MNKNLNLSSLNKLSINHATLNNQNVSALNLINYNYKNQIDESIYSTVETKDIRELTIKESKEMFLDNIRIDEVVKKDIQDLIAYLETNPNEYSTELLKNLHKIEITKFVYNEGEGSYVTKDPDSIKLQMDDSGEFAQHTLLHELGHAYHAEFDNFKMPENYLEIADSARNNMTGKEDFIFNLTNSYYIDYLQQRNEIQSNLMNDPTFRTKVIQSLQPQLETLSTMDLNFREKMKNKTDKTLNYRGLTTLTNEILIDPFETNDYLKSILNNQMEIMALTEARRQMASSMHKNAEFTDIIGSVLGGGFYCQLPNGQPITLFGCHSAEYYKNPQSQYDEQVANYFALKMNGSKEELDNLKYIMGDDWINMMETEMNTMLINMKSTTTTNEALKQYMELNMIMENSSDYNKLVQTVDTLKKEGGITTFSILQNLHKIENINWKESDKNPNGNAYYSLSEAVINFNYFNIPENYTNIIENANKTLTNNQEYHEKTMNYIASMQTAQYKKSYNQYILSLNRIYESASKASFVNKEELHVTLENTHQASEYANKTAYNDNFNLIAVSEILNSVSSGESSENQYKEQLIYFCSLKLQNKEGDLNTLKYLLGNEWYQTMEIGMNNITISLEEYHGKY